MNEWRRGLAASMGLAVLAMTLLLFGGRPRAHAQPGINGAQNPNCSTVAQNLAGEVEKNMAQFGIQDAGDRRRPPFCSPRPPGCRWGNLSACPMAHRRFATQGNILYWHRVDADGGEVVLHATMIGAGGQSSSSPNVGPLSGHTNQAIFCPDGRAIVLRDTAVVGTTNLGSGDNPNVTVAEEIPPFGAFNVLEVTPFTCNTLF